MAYGTFKRDSPDSNDAGYTFGVSKKSPWIKDTISKELDQRISVHLKKHFLDISSKVTSSFYERSTPFLTRTEEDFQHLHMQGEETLHFWKAMMKQFRSLWNRPFILMGLACILTDAVTSVFSSYLLLRDETSKGILRIQPFLGCKRIFYDERGFSAKTLKAKCQQ
jgi:hypothetical protein